jgi:hypothetical protein
MQSLQPGVYFSTPHHGMLNIAALHMCVTHCHGGGKLSLAAFEPCVMQFQVQWTHGVVLATLYIGAACLQESLPDYQITKLGPQAHPQRSQTRLMGSNKQKIST